MRQPNKPHRAGYEDEEDCEGHYDPDKAEERRCYSFRQRPSTDPCEMCFESWLAKEETERRAKWDALTPEEQAAHEAMVKGLRELY